MIALVYLAVAVFFGDAITRPWMRPVTWFHRLAIAFLVGILAATWLTYLLALAFDGAGSAMPLGNLASVLALGIAAVWLRRRTWGPAPGRPRRGIGRWDVILVTGVTMLVTWMMVSTYAYADGELSIAVALWSDFGPTTAIAQSFALGDNFPTEYPHYAGEPIRYHFLYYFQVGNLAFLGLDPATANNVLSIGSMVAMLVVVAALGERLFSSPAAGRIGAALFFAHGALSFIPYLESLGTLEDIAGVIPRLDAFVSSGFPYRGEDWGIWTQIVFLNQRHLASAIGILLIITIFLLDRLRDDRRVGEGSAEPRQGLGRRLLAAARRTGTSARWTARRPLTVLRSTVQDPSFGGYVLCGVLAGLLPLWNGAMFIGAAALLAVWLLVFPRRPSMIVLGIAASIVAIPQLLWIRPGTMAGEQTYPSLYWGYIVDDPTPLNVARYMAFVFGPKLLLVGIAFALVTWRERRVFLAFLSLVGVAFAIQLSVEVLANHKFINAWLIVANLFAGYALVRLWQARPEFAVPARMVALTLAVVIGVGGVIDLMPVKNQQRLGVGLAGDRLFDWVRTETEPTDVFLTDLYVVHHILLAGRRLHFGWPYYAWSAGYAVGAREDWYRQTFALRDPAELVRRLQGADISYVAFDDGLRGRGFAPRLNEELYERHFEPVFTDDTGDYANLVIYRVPPEPDAATRFPAAAPEDMYVGGVGRAPGTFLEPRGIAVDRRSNVYVADTGNGRVQRFSSSGDLVATIGTGADGAGLLDRPTGVSVTADGRIVVVTEAGGVHQFDAAGTMLHESFGRDGAFGELVDVATDGESAYVLDASNGRLVRIDSDGTETVIGGDGDGRLSRPTGLTVAAGLVYVADPGDARVVVFRADGTVERAIPIVEWVDGSPSGSADIVVDGSMVWLSDPDGGRILAYRDGSPLGVLPQPDAPLEGPAGLAMLPGRVLLAVDADAGRVTMVTRLEP